MPNNPASLGLNEAAMQAGWWPWTSCSQPRLGARPSFARPQRGGDGGGVVALHVMSSAEARGPPPATGSSPSSNLLHACACQRLLSCPRTPGTSCSRHKSSSQAWIGLSFLGGAVGPPTCGFITSNMSVRVANGSIAIDSSNMWSSLEEITNKSDPSGLQQQTVRSDESSRICYYVLCHVIVYYCLLFKLKLPLEFRVKQFVQVAD